MARMKLFVRAVPSNLSPGGSAELGYFAQKTQKYLKIFVRTDLNKDRSTKAIKTSIQENIESDPVCP